MKLGWQMAIRFLRSSKGQTLLIMMGIAIGVSVQIFIGSLIDGLQRSLIDKTIGNSSQITITAKSDSTKLIEDYETLLASITADQPEIKSAAVVLDNAAFLTADDQSQSILIRGFDIAQADKIYDIYDRIVEGTYPQQANELLLGIDLKEKYQLTVGDTVIITTTAQQVESFKIVGFFDFKVAGLNTGWGITTLMTAQQVFDAPGGITAIEMQLTADQVFQADTIAAAFAGRLDQELFQVDNWKAQNAQLLSGLQGQSISSYMIQVFVMISVVLGIASVLAITVLQKSKQVGILKAMGIRNKAAGYIFLFEGLLLGIGGAVLGILFGLGLTYVFTHFALNADGTPIIALYINYQFIGISGLIAVLASTMAALIPAIRSTKLNPIDIIRNN